MEACPEGGWPWEGGHREGPGQGGPCSFTLSSWLVLGVAVACEGRVLGGTSLCLQGAPISGINAEEGGTGNAQERSWVVPGPGLGLQGLCTLHHGLLPQSVASSLSPVPLSEWRSLVPPSQGFPPLQIESISCF